MNPYLIRDSLEKNEASLVIFGVGCLGNTSFYSANFYPDTFLHRKISWKELHFCKGGQVLGLEEFIFPEDCHGFDSEDFD